MKKILTYISVGVLSFVLTSCEKFLDEQPRHALTEENAITNAETARAALGGVYATFQNDDWAGGLYLALATKSGFVNFTSGTDETDYNLSYTQQTASNEHTDRWRQFYESLNAANFAIQGISALSEVAISDADKEALLAEGKCLRAWINVNILWNWAHWWADDDDPYGILYRDKPVNLTNVLQARLTVGESYQKIHEDLDFAIEKLPDFSGPRYVSKQFSKVLKAKLLLYRGGYRNTTSDLQAALSLVNDVLGDHPSSFKMETDLADVYAKAWDSSENLFVRYLENDGSRTTTGGYWYTYGIIYQGDALPLPPGGSLTAGLEYGLDWFQADPRWEIITGPVRAPETWDNTERYTFKKVARLGAYAGRQSNPPDEKYAAYYFRYPELYLMKAELLARTGASLADAIAPINTMRAQRTNPVLPALHPSSQQELMDMIFKEIFLELCLENGSEFFASLRFKNNGNPWIETIKDGKTLEENRICYPIPDAEMVNNTLMVQNPDLN